MTDSPAIAERRAMPGRDDERADYAARERVIGAAFHRFRSAGKKQDSPPQQRLREAVRARSMTMETRMADPKPPKEMTDAELRQAIEARDFEAEDYDTLIKEAESRELDF